MKKPQIAIIGYAGQEEYPKSIKINSTCYQYAYQIGKFIGKKGWILVTGGKSGIMEESSRGCFEQNGTTVGVISGSQRNQSNKYIKVEVVTNGYPTNEESVLIGMSDVIVMIGGGAGTLIELAISYRQSKPIIIIKNTGGWSDKIINPYLDERKRTQIKFVDSSKEAIQVLIKEVNKYERNAN